MNRRSFVKALTGAVVSPFLFPLFSNAQGIQALLVNKSKNTIVATIQFETTCVISYEMPAKDYGKLCNAIRNKIGIVTVSVSKWYWHLDTYEHGVAKTYEHGGIAKNIDVTFFTNSIVSISSPNDIIRMTIGYSNGAGFRVSKSDVFWVNRNEYDKICKAYMSHMSSIDTYHYLPNYIEHCKLELKNVVSIFDDTIEQGFYVENLERIPRAAVLWPETIGGKTFYRNSHI